ncbi:MAG: hydroxymethylbilane synthase [Gammaproteobacteria bacterium]|nr:hydroxymethylbilane synthase [Gammaproteobacteria bacterium]MBP9729400.1 hydroxymethylbilane synthase [Gammaproteobacteria bacterium]
MKKTLTIVSRKSLLALCQANLVKTQLAALHPTLEINIVGIQSTGDRFLDQPLATLGGKGLFVKALEDYLLAHRADIAVHSLKDMPHQITEGLALGAILQRASPYDAWYSMAYPTLQSLPPQARVGTSSLRRQAQLLALRPDLRIIPLRGNIDSRLEKLKAGHYEGIILAHCGVERLKMTLPFSTIFSANECLPAVGQGALAIECRVNDHAIQTLIEPLHHRPTAHCVGAERAMLACLEGGCQTPIAGFATLDQDGYLHLEGMVGKTDGSLLLKAEASGSTEQILRIGIEVADKLRQQGATELLRYP